MHVVRVGLGDQALGPCDAGASSTRWIRDNNMTCLLLRKFVTNSSLAPCRRSAALRAHGLHPVRLCLCSTAVNPSRNSTAGACVKCTRTPLHMPIMLQEFHRPASKIIDNGLDDEYAIPLSPGPGARPGRPPTLWLCLPAPAVYDSDRTRPPQC